MRFGLAIMNDFPPGTVPATRIGELREQVAVARECGIESIWLLHHYLGSMPTLQPLPTLGALAQQADGMRMGTNMFILPLHHPVQVAEAFSTLTTSAAAAPWPASGWATARTSSPRSASRWSSASAATPKVSR